MLEAMVAAGIRGQLAACCILRGRSPEMTPSHWQAVRDASDQLTYGRWHLATSC
jgi:hypothetical protein